MAGSQTHADQLHNQDRTNPVADDAVPLTEPQWTYQAGNAGSRYLHHMITCLLEGMLKSAHIHVNYDKIRKVTQEKDETPALLLSRLTEAVQKYTNLDISTPARLLYLHVHPPNPAPPTNNGATGKWIVLRHYPPNLGVHPRPNNNGPGTRLRGALAPQTMVPQMR